MIFIGPNFSDSNAHFVTNVIDSIGVSDDLIIDILKFKQKNEIFSQIKKHLVNHKEEYIIYNAKEDEDFFLYLRHYFPGLKLITVFSDDEWRHANYDRYLALYSDIFTIAVKDNIERYQHYGLPPFYMQWASNPAMFYCIPECTKDIDVSFIGAPYGKRLDYIRFLITNGVDVQVYGNGWERFADIKPYWHGFLSHAEMIQIINRSKINLNFLWTSADREKCTIKGRTLEISACGAFQLSNFTDEFSNYGFCDTENIAVFCDKADMLAKVRYYLSHDEEREDIARRAYEHVLRNHTWSQRFQEIFAKLDADSFVLPKSHRYRILVVAKKDVTHNIKPEAQRLEITFVDAEQNWQMAAEKMDGVVCLRRNSTLNNEALYMMAFGLVADKSDLIAANFYVGSDRKRMWIRFRDRLLEKRRDLLRLLPTECLMFAGRFAMENGCALPSDLQQSEMSYIEYPAFKVEIHWLKARRLRFYFGFHRDPRQQFELLVRSRKYGKALSLGVDKFWQRFLDKMVVKTGD